jgi:hypothetical protein
MVLGLAALSLTSCQREGLVPVSGSVRVNGQPANKAIVMFLPEHPASIHDRAATAVTGDDGGFKLASGSDAGAKPGTYIVTVIWPDPKKAPTDLERMTGASDYDAPDVLKGKYATRDGSPLRAEVKAGPTVLEPFELSTK